MDAQADLGPRSPHEAEDAFCMSLSLPIYCLAYDSFRSLSCLNASLVFIISCKL